MINPLRPIKSLKSCYHCGQTIVRGKKSHMGFNWIDIGKRGFGTGIGKMWSTCDDCHRIGIRDD